MPLTQTFDNDGEPVDFIDHRQNHHSALCEPRDIEILSGTDTRAVRQAICVDIRLGQGANPIGIAKNLKW